MGYSPSNLIAYCTELDLRSIGDQALPVNATKYVIKRIIVTNIIGTITGAIGGVYTAPSKGGTILVAANQAYTSVVNNRTFDLTLTANTNITVLTSPFIYLSLTTGSSTLGRADFYVLADVLNGI